MKSNNSIVQDMSKIIIEIGDKELTRICSSGAVKAGCNGPYHCKDTIIRNTSHWICIYKYLWDYTNDFKYLNAISILGKTLVDEGYYGSSGAVWCFYDNKIDHINGTIGQAWAIEGLLSAYETTGDSLYLNRAYTVFTSQRYDYDRHLWERIELNGNTLGIDPVFNHQLWFAAIASQLLKHISNREIGIIIGDFVNNIERLFDIYREGLIKHYVNGLHPANEKKWKEHIKTALSPLGILDQKYDKRLFERGYHLFNLMGFALLQRHFKNAAVFGTDKFKKALEFGLDLNNIDRLLNEKKLLGWRKTEINRYGFLYNSPAFEFPYVDYSFADEKHAFNYMSLLNAQIVLTMDDRGFLTKRTDDGETLTARLYELTYYLESKV